MILIRSHIKGTYWKKYGKIYRDPDMFNGGIVQQHLGAEIQLSRLIPYIYLQELR